MKMHKRYKKTYKNNFNKDSNFMDKFYSFCTFCLNKFFLLGVIFSVVFILLRFNVVQNKLQSSILSSTSKYGMGVKEILIEGYKRTSKKNILNTINIQKGNSILAYNPKKIKEKLERLPWIKSAKVERNLTGKIYISISEHKPVALFQENKKLYLIDNNGNIINFKDVSEFSNLFIIIGKHARKNFSSLIKILNDYPIIKRRVTSAIFISERRWDLILDNKLRIKLPEQDLEKAFTYLAQLDKEHYLNGNKIISVDIRLEGRSFFYLAPEALAKRRKLLGKYT